MSKGIRFRAQKSIKNWKAYNEGLKARYDVTLWIDESVLVEPKRDTGKRGRPYVYSDAIIEMLLHLRCLYSLPLRGTEGLAKSLFRLMSLPEKWVPDYTTLSRRSTSLKVDRQVMEREHAIHLVVDSTGLKVCGEGEWKVRQHGVSKRRTWRKLHLGVDEYTGEIIADDLTENSTGDQEHLPVLLDQIDTNKTPLRQISVDGIYDTYECYNAATDKGTKLVCPPRKNAKMPGAKDPPHPRREAIRQCQQKGRKRWKKESGYHRRSLSETAMFRFKTSFGGRLRAREMPQQKTEARIKVKILNQFTQLAKPVYA